MAWNLLDLERDKNCSSMKEYRCVLITAVVYSMVSFIGEFTDSRGCLGFRHVLGFDTSCARRIRHSNSTEHAIVRDTSPDAINTLISIQINALASGSSAHFLNDVLTNFTASLIIHSCLCLHAFVKPQ